MSLVGYKEKIGIYTQISEDKYQMELVHKYLILQVDFASWNYPFRKLRNCLATYQLSVLQWFLSSSYFASWIPQLAKLLDGWFLLWFSFLHPRLALAKGYEAPKLSFFMNLSFNLLCHELYKDFPHSWIALVTKNYQNTKT